MPKNTSEKWMVAVVVVGALLCGGQAHAEPKERAYGIWTETYKLLSYVVDTNARICFVGSNAGYALAEVDCDKVARRDEWKPIITWVSAAD